MSESKIPFTKTAVGEFSFSYGSFFVLFLGFVKTVPMSNKFAYVSSFSLQKTFFSRTTTLSLLPLRGGSESIANTNCIIVARALSSGLPRHLTCTSIGLLFQKKSMPIWCLAILAKGASGVRRKDSGSAEDILEYVRRCLFTNGLLL